MINFILTFSGTILLIYSAFLCHVLNRKIDKEIKNKTHSIILILIYGFIFGYLVFLTRLFMNYATQGVNELLVSAIFFFGALFVVIVLKINHSLILDLSASSLNFSKLNVELKNRNKELHQTTEALKISEEKYKKRSKELDETLENFYTMRTSLLEQRDKGELEEENKEIKRQLDAVRGGDRNGVVPGFCVF